MRAIIQTFHDKSWFLYNVFNFAALKDFLYFNREKRGELLTEKDEDYAR